MGAHKRVWIRLAVVAVLVVAFLIPKMTQHPLLLHIFTMIAINTILAVSLRLIMLTGQISFAHAGMMAVGGYACAILVTKLGISFWLGLPLGGLAAAAVAVVLGYPTLRIKGVYFFLVSFAFAEIVRYAIIANWGGITGGPQGIMNIPPPSQIAIPGLPRVEFVSNGSRFILALVLMLITLLVMYRLDRTRYGKTFQAIEQADLLAETIGVNIMRYKVMAFAIGCFFAGIAGAFYAHFLNYLGPQDFTFVAAIHILAYTVVGGMGSILGPLLGAVLLGGAKEVFRPYPAFANIGFALVLLMVVLFLPRGILGLPNAVSSLVKRLRPKARVYVDKRIRVPGGDP